jgi:DNA polymerase-3 subunit delta'
VKGVEGEFDVVGAQAPLAFFASLGALSHGYLFTGPSGVGKKTFARRIAQSLLCETPKATLLGYCNRCTGCTLFRAGTHPDFVAQEGVMKIRHPESEPLEDRLRLTSDDIVRELSLHGYRSRYRVVLLGDVGFATHEAANALLKFFEEPAAGVVAFLTTDAPGTLLPTIRSRLVELRFQPLAPAEVAEILRREGTSAEAATVAAAAAQGSVTRARSVLDAESSGLRDASFAWFAEAMTGGHPDASFLALDDRSLTAAEKRALVGELIEIVRVAARDWSALCLTGADAPLLAPDQRARIAGLPKRSPGETVALLGALNEAERIARSNVSAGLVVDFLRMQLAPV